MEAIVAINRFGRIGTMTLRPAYKKSVMKRVIIFAPANDPDITAVIGVNHKDHDPRRHPIISNASCTRNSLAPIWKVLLGTCGTEKGLMTTIHAYKTDQWLLDLPHKDLRRARAGALPMVPTTTAAKAVTLVIPELAGKMNGMTLRVPTPNVPLTNLVAQLSQPTSAQEVNEASRGSMNRIIEYSNEPLISTDFKGITDSTGIDALPTVLTERFGVLRTAPKALQSEDVVNPLEPGNRIGAFFGNQRALATWEVTQGREVDYEKCNPQ